MATVLHADAFEDNYIWLIRGHGTNHVAIVDPGDAEPVIRVLDAEGLSPVAILCTHHHWDHTGANRELVKRYAIPVYGPQSENIPEITYRLNQGDHVAPDGLGLEFVVLDVPGHTAGHIAYYGHGMLFCGDTLFSGGCGRLFEGTPEEMFDSLSKLAGLPDDTQVYCAHEYTRANLRFALAVEADNPELPRRLAEVERLQREHTPSIPSTIGLERQTNPFLRTAEPGVISAVSNHVGRELNSSVEVFAVLRRWKDGFRG
jgi:hydroxyacylglutathione hydrolase